MTCRCRTKEEHAQRAVEATQQAAQWRDRENAERIRELSARSPNPDEYTVIEVEQVGKHLALKVRYPGCEKCDFDRCKVMVYLGVSLKDVILWRRIDPHFRASGADRRIGGTNGHRHEAPSPAARFPGDEAGWADALEYARRK